MENNKKVNRIIIIAIIIVIFLAVLILNNKYTKETEDVKHDPINISAKETLFDQGQLDVSIENMILQVRGNRKIEICSISRNDNRF